MSRVENKDVLVFNFFVEYEFSADEVAQWIDQSYRIKGEEPPDKYSSGQLFDWALDFIIEETKTEDELHRIFILTEEGIRCVAYPEDVEQNG